jgi:flagellar secretion chaperone FliS
MTPNNAFNQYKQNSIYNASSEELTLMLYNGLVKFIMISQSAIIEKNMEKAHENIIRAQNIINEFQITLDKKFDIANNLAQLYDYMYRRLIEANLKKDNDILDEVLGFARELRDTWSQAVKLARRKVQLREAK